GSQQQQQSISTRTEGGTSGSQATSTPANYNPFTSALFGDISNLAGSLGGGQFGAFPAPQGPFAAPISGGESNVLSALPQGYGSSAASGAYINKLLSGGFLPGAAGSNPFLEASIAAAQRPTLTGLNQVLSQDLPSQFIKSGQVFNPRAAAGSGGQGALTDT